MYNWDFDTLLPYILPLMIGLWTTLWISCISILFGSAMGILLAMARKIRTIFIKIPAIAFIEVFLAMPVLVLLIWVYYCLPLLIHIRLSGIATAIIVFSFSLSAFVAETMRSGIDAVPDGQVDAALSL